MIGILANDLLLTSDRQERILTGKTWDICNQWTLGRLMNLAKHYQLSQLWILRDTDFWQAIKRASETGNFPQFWRPGQWTIRPEKIAANSGKNMLTGWNDSGFRCQLHFPGMAGENWGFDEIADPYDLINALIEFRDRLGVPASFVFKTSKDLLEKSMSRPEKFSDDNSSFWEPFANKNEREWIELYKPKIRAGLYAHAFDKRMMFLSAARGGTFGGGPFQTVGKCRYSDLNKKTVGLVEVKPLKIRDPFIKKLIGKEQVFYTPYLEFLKDYCPGIEITRGWLWTETSRRFELYAKRLGDAIKGSRGSDLAEVRAVNSAFKLLYVQLFGWFGRLDNRDGYAAEYYRPDWRGLIIANANTNLLRNIMEVKQKRGLLPFAIYHDCLMYFSDHQDPTIEFAGTSLLDGNKFTHEWTLPADQVFDAIDDGKGPGQIDELGKRSGPAENNPISTQRVAA